ncbi:CsbD family protein [Nocardia miyunensis]|uniref:CsbD family protein n=1 Tax=Nocardia miyunensis TaxID=282684 RepID=UPI00082CAA75|nr:CsbD family protein [Nocardia miyunensis]
MGFTNKAKNRADKLAGQVKEKIGEMTNNPRLRNEGKADQVKSNLKTTAEKIRDTFRK